MDRKILSRISVFKVIYIVILPIIALYKLPIEEAIFVQAVFLFLFIFIEIILIVTDLILSTSIESRLKLNLIELLTLFGFIFWLMYQNGAFDF